MPEFHRSPRIRRFVKFGRDLAETMHCQVFCKLRPICFEHLAERFILSSKDSKHYLNNLSAWILNQKLVPSEVQAFQARLVRDPGTQREVVAVSRGFLFGPSGVPVSQTLEGPFSAVSQPTFGTTSKY